MSDPAAASDDGAARREPQEALEQLLARLRMHQTDLADIIDVIANIATSPSDEDVSDRYDLGYEHGYKDGRDAGIYVGKKRIADLENELRLLERTVKPPVSDSQA